MNDYSKKKTSTLVCPLSSYKTEINTKCYSTCGTHLRFGEMMEGHIGNDGNEENVTSPVVEVQLELQRSPTKVHCPFTVCKESSKPDVIFDEFVLHLTNGHRVPSAPNGVNVFTREMCVGKGNMWRFKRDGPKSPFLMHCYNFQFIQHTFSANGKFWFWISVMGSQTDADKFRAVLTVCHSSNKGRKIGWKGDVHFVNTNENEVYNSDQCLVVERSTLEGFMDIKNDKMLWNLKIEIHLKDGVQDSDYDVCFPDEPSENRKIPKTNSTLKSQVKRSSKGKRKVNSSR